VLTFHVHRSPCSRGHVTDRDRRAGVGRCAQICELALALACMTEPRLGDFSADTRRVRVVGIGWTLFREADRRLRGPQDDSLS
jgi:hypothetical protein